LCTRQRKKSSVLYIQHLDKSFFAVDQNKSETNSLLKLFGTATKPLPDKHVIIDLFKTEVTGQSLN